MEAAILTAHIAGGVVGLLSGFVAIVARKGARTHRAAGTVFFVAMPINGATAATLGVLHASPEDIFAGFTTVYLVATAWLTVRRMQSRFGAAEVAAGLAALGAAVFIISSPMLANALDEPEKILTPSDYVAASLYGLAGVADLSVVLRGGLSGAQRIARHLWRMHAGFLIAVGSFFPGQIQVFPRFVREIQPVALLFTPPLLVLALMAFWLVCVLATGWRRPA